MDDEAKRSSSLGRPQINGKEPEPQQGAPHGRSTKANQGMPRLLRRTPEGFAAPETLADDILYGAAAIAEFLFGDPKLRRRIFHLASLKGRRRLPVFKVGGARICARKSTLLVWIADQEGE